MKSYFKSILFCILISGSVFFGQVSMAQKSQNNYRIKGLTCITDVGIGAGIGSYSFGGQDVPNSETVLSLSSVVSYMLGGHFSAGAGLEFDKWKLISFLPVYVDLRYYVLSNKKMVPFVFLDGGFARKWGTSPRTSKVKFSAGSNGDLFGAAGIGLKTYISRTSAINFSIGCKIQKINLSYLVNNVLGTEAPDFISELTNFQFFSIKVGFSF